MNRSELLIMRTTQFGEADLILCALSPEYGKLDFILKGARKTGPRKFPAAGLFRVVSAEFRDPSGESMLLSMRNVTPVRNFDSIANHLSGYMAACGYMRHLLAVCRPMAECPETYRAALILLERLSSGMAPEIPVMLARLVSVQESGLLPEAAPDRAELQEALLAAGLDEGPIPELSSAYWGKLSAWTDTLSERQFR